MNDDLRREYVTRDSILKLLSDDEIARVSTAETADRLGFGDEYLDLEQLHYGVQRAGDAPTTMARVLPRKAIQEDTWFKMVRHLAAHRARAAAHDPGPDVDPRSSARQHTVVGAFASHPLAEGAIKALQAGGIDMKKLSIVGKNFHSEEHAIGFYTSGDRMRFWGGQGAFFGSLWGMLFGGAFIFVPGLGPLVAMGPLVGFLAGALEGAVLGGAAGIFGAALASLGVPDDQRVLYETEIKAGRFLVIARGGAAEIERAHAILGTSGASSLRAQPVSS